MNEWMNTFDNNSRKTQKCGQYALTSMEILLLDLNNKKLKKKREHKIVEQTIIDWLSMVSKWTLSSHPITIAFIILMSLTG